MYDKICLETFLKNQERLFDQPVAENLEEAEEFLDDSMAQVLDDIKELKEYMEENMDIADMSDEELLEQPEVFELPDGRFLVVL